VAAAGAAATKQSRRVEGDNDADGGGSEKPSGEAVAGEEIQLKLRVAAGAPFRPNGAESEMYFSLWSDTLQRFVTEEFVVKLNASGVPDEVNLFDRLHTVFTDLDRDKISAQKLSLVCRIYRVGGSLKGGASEAAAKKQQPSVLSSSSYGGGGGGGGGDNAPGSRNSRYGSRVKGQGKGLG
jgi:hypothetical protein